ncbi:DUF3231 family protein [Salirhabdus salicampi]|uniref:DUF3231 family protein n=1 Tax=Salirhabdus salicampi TaxID=476102 RepID=UPI0020C43F96|nr:DUF3231 family protein [Salirhabdus salicampi]MCP8615982.1 DUF3231 family protein [Salirhabdus salicampi]
MTNKSIDQEKGEYRKGKSLHISDTMYCWTYLSMLEEFKGITDSTDIQEDEELVQFIQVVQELTEGQRSKLVTFMEEEKLYLSKDKEKKSTEQTDVITSKQLQNNRDIAQTVNAKLTACVTICGTAIAKASRKDLAELYFQFFTEMMKYATKCKALLGKRGWLQLAPNKGTTPLTRDQA